MQTEKERELARLRRKARESQKQIDQIINDLASHAFDLGYANGKIAAMLNQPYRPPDIIKAEQVTAHQYWKGWREGRRAAIEDGYEPTVKLPKPPKPTPPQ